MIDFNSFYNQTDEPIENVQLCKIKVMGVGGAGNNAVNRMIESGITSAEFVAVNTDRQALMMSKAAPENRIVIGKNLTGGLGAGSDPEIGANAAEESREEIERALEGVNLLFITAGMGGGTGTGAAPVIARIAKAKGCLTVAVVTKPFEFEGKRRFQNAVKGIANLRKYVDTMVIIPNDKLLSSLSQDVSMLDALKFADDTLRQGICGISDLIATPALINLDFADVKTIIKDQGLAHMGVGKASGENKVINAARKAINSPLLETTIEGAKGVILNVTGGKDLTLSQVIEISKIVRETVDDASANIIFGANIREDIEDQIEITVIATGFEYREQITRPTQFSYNEQRVAPTSKEEHAQPLKYSEEQPIAQVEQSKPENKPQEEQKENVIPTVNKPAAYDFAELELDVEDEEEPVLDDEDDGLPMFMKRLLEKER